MISSLRFFALAAFLPLFSLSAATDIVFLAGSRSHGPGEHEFHAGCQILAKALNEQSGLDVRARVIQGWPADESVLDTAKAVVIYADATSVVGKGWAKMEALAKKGVGFLFMHYAVHPSAEEGEKYYRPWIGGAFETGWSVNPHWVADLNALPSHPVARGITGPVEVYDEFYYNMRFPADRAKVQDLVTATPTRERIKRYINLWNQQGVEGIGKKQTLMWGIERPDGGRGVGFTGGHYHRNWSVDGYRKLVLNAVVWVAGMEVPSAGVVSAAVSEEQLNLNLDDKGPNKPRQTVPPPGEFRAMPPAPIQEEREKGFLKPSSEQAQKPATGPAEKAAAKAAPNVVKDDGSEFVPPGLFAVPEGLEVTVWASSPMLQNPTNIDFDENGRLWVAEGVNYRGKGGRRPEGDRIVVLEDTKGAGRADRSTVFVQESALASPLGVAVFGDRIVVSQPPDMLVYTDRDRNGVYDAGKESREVLLTGFNGRQHDHSLHSVTAGPDGLWYWNQGNMGAQFTDRSGRKFYMGSPYMLQDIAGKKSDDGHVWIGGFAARMNPDGSQVEVIGHNFRNSYEQAVTSMGDVFQSDNDDPPACRVTPVMEGGNAGFASADGKRAWSADRRPGQETPVAEWRQEDPGTMPAGDVYGGGSPTGVGFYENGALGEQWNGLLLACEAGKNVVFGYRPKPDGAGWKMERFDFFTSNREKEFAGSDFLGGKATGELKTKFRPSDVVVGPDGAIYVADWFDARVGGHGTMDDRATGAIYRIAPKGFKSVVPKLDLTTLEGQIAALKSPAVNVRFGGFARLKARGADAVPAVSELLKDGNPYVAARAVWLLAQLGEPGMAVVKPWLDASEDWKRVVAYRALRRVVPDLAVLAAKMSHDRSPAVRREVALSMRNVPAQAAVPILVSVAAKFDGKDRAYLEALGLGAEGKESQLFAALKRTFGAPEHWNEAASWITWRLHPVQAVAAMKERLLSPNTNLEDRKRMLDGLAFVEDPSAAVALMDAAAAKDFPLKDQSLWWLKNRKGNLWKEYGIDQALMERGLVQVADVKLTAVEIPETPKGAPELPSVAEIARLAGDSGRGKTAVGVCYACHRIGSQGIEFGPDLTTFAKQQPAEVLIQAIAKPSHDISHGYEGSLLVSTDGVKIAGMVLSNADPVLIKCMGNVVQTIPRKRVSSLMPLGRSLMYDPAVLGLNAQAIADIAAYLRSL